MICDQVREAVSARLDGEDPGLPTAMLDAHLEGCSACTAWAVAAADVMRAARVNPAEVAPDRTHAILAAARGRGLLDHDLAVRQSPWRWVLASLGAAQLLVTVPMLLWGDGSDAPAHLLHELGAWDIALAVGFVFAAWRPARAWGMLPLVAALVGCLMLMTAIDIVEGNAVAADEAAHALELLGLAVLWRLARPAPLTRAPALRLA